MSRRNRRSDHQIERRRVPIPCTNHLIVAPLWVCVSGKPRHRASKLSCRLGHASLCPKRITTGSAMKGGDTLPSRPCMHGVDSKIGWIERNQQQGAQVIGVELDEDSIPLAEVRPAQKSKHHPPWTRAHWTATGGLAIPRSGRRDPDDGRGHLAQCDGRGLPCSVQACCAVLKGPVLAAGSGDNLRTSSTPILNFSIAATSTHSVHFRLAPTCLPAVRGRFPWSVPGRTGPTRHELSGHCLASRDHGENRASADCPIGTMAPSMRDGGPRSL